MAFDSFYGQGSQGAWQAAGSPKSFRPGQAQPIQPQSQGTPYQPYGGVGNYGNMSPANRPPPFTTTATDWTGQQMSPSQMFGQRDAFIQQINDAQGRQSALSGLSNGAPQQMDFGSMTSNAQKMQQNGWQNPFSQDNVMGGQPSPGQWVDMNVHSNVADTIGPDGRWTSHYGPSNWQWQGGGQPTSPPPGGGNIAQPIGALRQDLLTPLGWSYGYGPGGGGGVGNGSVYQPIGAPRQQLPDYYGTGGGNEQYRPQLPAPQPAPQPKPPQPQPPSSPAPSAGRGNSGPGQAWYQNQTKNWVDQTRRANNDPNGAMQQMLRGMTPANRAIYGMMANNFSAFGY